MIISQTPLRVSLGGGGTDLPFFYKKYEGFVLSAAIQKFIYIIVSHRFEKNLRISYSKTEICDSVDKVKHPIIRECLHSTNFKDHLEIVSIADMPANSGLGSSGSFTVGLLHALQTYSKKDIVRKDLAEEACHIEMNKLKEPSGKQDQYIAAFGGFSCLKISKDGKVDIEKLKLSNEFKHELENRLSFFYTGITRSAQTVLGDQRNTAKNTNSLDHLLKIKEIGIKSKDYLEKEDVDSFGDLLDEHWNLKKKTSSKISTSIVDKYYKIAKDIGVSGGKIIGAGGGGFFMFYSKTDLIKKKLIKKFNKIGLMQANFPFESHGTRIILDVGEREN